VLHDVTFLLNGNGRCEVRRGVLVSQLEGRVWDKKLGVSTCTPFSIMVPLEPQPVSESPK
jgi:hypothetical protein